MKNYLAEKSTVLADPTGGITSLTSTVQDNVVPLVITLVGVVALFVGRRGEVSKVVTIGACVLIGVGVLAFAAAGPRNAIIAWVQGLLGG